MEELLVELLDKLDKILLEHVLDELSENYGMNFWKKHLENLYEKLLEEFIVEIQKEFLSKLLDGILDKYLAFLGNLCIYFGEFSKNFLSNFW